MKIVAENKTTLNGLTLHTISTEKYKTNTLVLKLKAPLEEKNVTQRALLPYVLQSETSRFPSSTLLRTYLDDLYGATLNVDLMKKGEYQIITFRMDIANESFLSDQTPLLVKGLELLADIINSPVIENNGFKESTVEKEKRSLKQRIQAVYDDKMRYSNLRLVQEMCKNEPYSLHVNGRIEDIDSITPSSLYRYYNHVLQNDEIDLYVVGNIDTQNVESTVKDLFIFKSREKVRSTLNEKKSVENEHEVIEEQDVKQGKLNIGYRTNSTYADNDYYALQLFNGVFGGFSHSKLFINVREKESLAYYAASRVESHKGLLMVMSGIENKNYEKAVSIIKEQMQAMKNGDFSDEEIAQTKAVIKNQLLETVDTARGLVEIFYHNVVSTEERQFEEWLEGIDKVTKPEIIDVANKIELDTIYFLKGLEATN
ncbi:insulinase family protein [Bacillus timonensis]|nr:insulinase family protein [Bacillus timonensis]